MGLETIAVYSDADRNAEHVALADVAYRLGPAPANQSYLDVEALCRAIAETGADAVHPGYGFLSENSAFAQAVINAGARFVGPTPDAIEAMGSKVRAKELVGVAGTPVVPGYNGADQSPEGLAAAAVEVGYPLLIKAAMGGGGKGMRLVESPADFDAALAGAKRESMASFSDDVVLLERYLTAPKHIEVQILADAAGKTLYLFERDCSVQRRHQKVIEEAPAAGLDPAHRRAMGEAAAQAARAIGYVGAGTIEFIAEGDDFFFMEMNTRLQVEHPVTEAILGVDLVEWQIRIAAGEPLALEQDAFEIDGHAIEARVYAENPKRRFLPSTGQLHVVEFADNVRVDAGVRSGGEVTVHYDPMIAKVIAHAPTRAEAIGRLDDALAGSAIMGVEHNIGYLRNVLAHPTFVGGAYTTRLADEAQDELLPTDDAVGTAVGMAAWLASRSEADPWRTLDGFSINRASTQRLRFRRNRKTLEATITWSDPILVVSDDGEFAIEDLNVDATSFSARVAGKTVSGRWHAVGMHTANPQLFVARGGSTERLDIQWPDPQGRAPVAGQGGRIVAPMPGQIVSVAVKVGDKVKVDDVLVVLEAMKMEHSIRATVAGTVKQVLVDAGDRVEEEIELVVVESG